MLLLIVADEAELRHLLRVGENALDGEVDVGARVERLHRHRLHERPLLRLLLWLQLRLLLL